MKDFFQLEYIKKDTQGGLFGSFAVVLPKGYAMPLGTLLRSILLSEFPTFGLQSLFLPYFEYSRVKGMKGSIQDLVERTKQIGFEYQQKPSLISMSSIDVKTYRKKVQEKGCQPFTLKNSLFLGKKLIEKTPSHVSDTNKNAIFRGDKLQNKYLRSYSTRRAKQFEAMSSYPKRVEKMDSLQSPSRIFDEKYPRKNDEKYPRQKNSPILHDLRFEVRLPDASEIENKEPVIWRHENFKERPLCTYGFQPGSLQSFVEDFTYAKLQKRTQLTRRIGSPDDSYFGFLSFGQDPHSYESVSGDENGKLSMAMGGGNQFFAKDMNMEYPIKVVNPSQFIGEIVDSDFHTDIWFKVGYEPKLRRTHPFHDPLAYKVDHSAFEREISHEEKSDTGALYEIDCTPIPSTIRKVDFKIEARSRTEERLRFSLYTTPSTHPAVALTYARGKILARLREMQGEKFAEME